jgi:bisphosphoglycerate-independent phosphoglycerate mutase (AlkP superfamily)
MDRLVIESILAEAEKIYLSDDSENAESDSSLMLGFRADHAEQVAHAFTALKNVTRNKVVELVICKTLVSGIYDLEIKTDALDEPVRILNKAIANDLLEQIEKQLQQNSEIVLGTNVAEQESWITLTDAQVKECTVKGS